MIWSCKKNQPIKSKTEPRKASLTEDGITERNKKMANPVSIRVYIDSRGDAIECGIDLNQIKVSNTGQGYFYELGSPSDEIPTKITEFVNKISLRCETLCGPICGTYEDNEVFGEVIQNARNPSIFQTTVWTFGPGPDLTDVWEIFYRILGQQISPTVPFVTKEQEAQSKLEQMRNERDRAEEAVRLAKEQLEAGLRMWWWPFAMFTKAMEAIRVLSKI